MKTQPADSWSVANSAAPYGINQWGGNFAISAKGEVNITSPFADGKFTIPVIDIIQGVRDRDHQLPLLLRVENLLDARATEINETFPVKVNQQRTVIEEISGFGAVFGNKLLFENINLTGEKDDN